MGRMGKRTGAVGRRGAARGSVTLRVLRSREGKYGGGGGSFGVSVAEVEIGTVGAPISFLEQMRFPKWKWGAREPPGTLRTTGKK